MAITSEATEMSKPVSRGTPPRRWAGRSAPRPMTMLRSAQPSLMSTTRFQEMESGLMLSGLSCFSEASMKAASRLLAADTAWMSPVKCRLKSSIGSTCE